MMSLLPIRLGKTTRSVMEHVHESCFPLARFGRAIESQIRPSRMECKRRLLSGGARPNSQHALFLADLKSKFALDLPAPVCLGKPGILLKATPTKTVSLALHLTRAMTCESLLAMFDSACSLAHVLFNGHSSVQVVLRLRRPPLVGLAQT